MSDGKMWEIEDGFFSGGVAELVCGVDEAGRGPLAGPVYAAAVILPPHLGHPRSDGQQKADGQKAPGAVCQSFRSLGRSPTGIGFATREGNRRRSIFYRPRF